jgi:hypothetical protein
MFEVHVRVHLNVSRHRCHKTLHNRRVETTNTCSYIPIHLSVWLFGLTLTRRVFSYSSHDFIFSDLREMNVTRRTFHTVWNPSSCSTCHMCTSDTLKRSTNSRLTARKISVSSKMCRSFRLYLHFYWLFPCGLNNIKLKVACLNCASKRINAVTFLGSNSSY